MNTIVIISLCVIISIIIINILYVKHKSLKKIKKPTNYNVGDTIILNPGDSVSENGTFGNGIYSFDSGKFVKLNGDYVYQVDGNTLDAIKLYMNPSGHLQVLSTEGTVICSAPIDELAIPNSYSKVDDKNRLIIYAPNNNVNEKDNIVTIIESYFGNAHLIIKKLQNECRLVIGDVMQDDSSNTITIHANQLCYNDHLVPNMHLKDLTTGSDIPITYIRFLDGNLETFNDKGIVSTAWKVTSQDSPIPQDQVGFLIGKNKTGNPFPAPVSYSYLILGQYLDPVTNITHKSLQAVYNDASNPNPDTKTIVWQQLLDI